MASPVEVRRAASRAHVEIKSLSLAERLQRIERLKHVILERRESIIDRLQKETRKCRTDVLMSEIFSCLDHLEYLKKFAPKVLKTKRVWTPWALMGKKSEVWLEPLGTVLVISPWNYPFYQAIVPCMTSFVCGNATIYKPSEHTPLRGLLEALFQLADFVPEWIQVVYGDGGVGAELVAQRPEKVFFTGSVRTGKKIMAQASENLTPVELELGGKDPMIVFEDANIPRAAAGAAWGGLTNCGQTCTSVERIYVHEKIYTPFRIELWKRMRALEQGVDTDGSADVGEMTVDFQIETIKDQLEKARASGAEIQSTAPFPEGSRKFPPALVEGLSHTEELAREETFGPILPIFPFKDEAEAVSLANDSPYGLSASVWTGDSTRARRVAAALVTGNVSVNNVMLTEGNPALPFGGVKNSGFGRYKGEFGFYSFSNIKSVLFDANKLKFEVNWYPYTPKKYQLFTQMMVGLFSGGFLNFVKFILAGLRLETYSNRIGKSGKR